MDLNGTLAVDGVLIPGVAMRIAELQTKLQFVICSADTFGTADAIAADLGVTLRRLTSSAPESQQKAVLVQEFGPDRTVAIGNGVNDHRMLKDARIGIAILGEEGVATATLHAASIVVPSIISALDLLRHPKRLMATLRD